jgi:hypothetical protein
MVTINFSPLLSFTGTSSVVVLISSLMSEAKRLVLDEGVNPAYISFVFNKAADVHSVLSIRFLMNNRLQAKR